jgi:anaerobic ribonucleoside-triphosphate reductase activating protein
MSSETEKSAPRLRLAGRVGRSRVNGPGLRAVIWVQGCTLGCAACFNPATHARGEADEPVDTVVSGLLADWPPAVEGLSLSGGEPFQQAVALAALCEQVRAARPQANLLAFSGYTLEELRGLDAPPGAAALLAQLDVLVDGRFDVQAPTQRPWRASANQRLWILGRRPTETAAAASGTAEVHVEADGSVLLSGFPDPALRRAIRELAR